MRILVFTVALALCAGAMFAASALQPVIKNAGFDDAGPAIPSWEWYPGSGASCAVDTTNPHSGQRCLAFANGVEKPIIENFGRLQQWFGLLPGMSYELSVWIRGEDVVAGNYFTDWCNFEMPIPAGTYGWKRVSKTFFASNNLNWVNFGLNVIGPAKSFALDDIELRPVGTPIAGKGVTGSYTTPGRVDGDDKLTPISISLSSSLRSPATLEVTVKAANKTVFSKTAKISPGHNVIDFGWNSGKLMISDLAFSLRVIDAKGKTIASARQRIEKCSQGILLAGIDAVESRLKGEFAQLYAKCNAKGIPTDYPTASRTMVEQFIPLARQDAKSDPRRCYFELRDMSRSLDASIAELRASLKDPKQARTTVRYQTSELTIDGLSLIGERKDTQGNITRGPLFFCGYGHFFQARNDIPKFPGYGVNIIQSSEFGPSAVLPSENEVSYEQINTLIRTLDDAAKHNVKVDVLISPHYFPTWPLAKWPQIGTGGFFGYPADMPEAKFVNEKFLRILVPMIKDKPALHSLCLTNEPAFDNSHGAQNTKPMWIGYLTERFGDVANLNTRYGAAYKSFDEVPMGGGFDAPQFYDWCIFNRHRFAAWHKWVADVIHEMAPGLPVHSKVCTIVTMPSRIYSGNGVDLEMMGKVCEFNGNDCCDYNRIGGQYASNWQLQNVVYDMQRSFNRKPIFNSENHISRDFSTNDVAPEHFRKVLWQGAIHGQASTTIWIWERATNNPGAWCFYGNVMDRPGCAEAVGTTCMDLNRYSAEVTALQNVKAPVAILYSNASFMKDREYNDTMNRAYEALNSCGVKVDFVSELQLARGDGSNYRLLVLPQVTHLPDDALKGLLSLPKTTRLVTVGDGPCKDAYGRDIAPGGAKRIADRSLRIDGGAAPRAIWPILRKELSTLKSLPAISVVDARTGAPVWGVEWLSARVNGREVINLVNLTSKPLEVKILSSGRQVHAEDLLSVGGPTVRVLKPELPVLAVY